MASFGGYFCALIVFIILLAQVNAAPDPPKCLNAEGEEVGWWFLLKDSVSYGYWYYDGTWNPENDRDWLYLEDHINEEYGHLGRTMGQINPDDYAYAFFNDQPVLGHNAWGDATSNTGGKANAHAKGWIAYNKGNDKSGIYVMHTVPGLPVVPKKSIANDQNAWLRVGEPGWFPDSGYKNAQHFFCYEFTDDQLTNIAAQLAFEAVFVFRTNLVIGNKKTAQVIPGTDENVRRMLLPLNQYSIENVQTPCKQAIENAMGINVQVIQACSRSLIFPITFGNGEEYELTFIAKVDSFFGDNTDVAFDLWTDLIWDHIKRDPYERLLAWTHQEANFNIPRLHRNTDDVFRTVRPESSFGRIYDGDIMNTNHAKLGVGSHTPALKFCMADVNRFVPKGYSRGGGALCLDHPVLANVFQRMIQTLESGPNNISQATFEYVNLNSMVEERDQSEVILHATIEIRQDQGESLYPRHDIAIGNTGQFQTTFRYWRYPGTIVTELILELLFSNSLDVATAQIEATNPDGATITCGLTKNVLVYETDPECTANALTYIFFVDLHITTPANEAWRTKKKLIVQADPDYVPRLLVDEGIIRVPPNIYMCQFLILELYTRFQLESIAEGFYQDVYNSDPNQQVTPAVAAYLGIILGYTMNHYVQDYNQPPLVPECALQIGANAYDLEFYYSAVKIGNTNVGWIAAAIYDLLDKNNDGPPNDDNYGALHHRDNNQDDPVGVNNINSAIIAYQEDIRNGVLQNPSIVDFYETYMLNEMSQEQRQLIKDNDAISVFDRLIPAINPPGDGTCPLNNRRDVLYSSGSLQEALSNAGICSIIIDKLTNMQIANITTVLSYWVGGTNFSINQGIRNLLYAPNVLDQTSVMKSLQTMSISPESSAASCGIPLESPLWFICDPMAVIWGTNEAEILLNYASDKIQYGAQLDSYYIALPYYLNMSGMGVRVVSFRSQFCSIDIVPYADFTSASASGLCDTAPQVLSISPTLGPAIGGYSVTITGFNFVASSTVAVGNETCTSVIVTNGGNLLTCTIPPGIGTRLLITVYSEAGFEPSSTYFSYNAPNMISISPTSGPTQGGTLLQISGSNFGPVSSSSTRAINIGTMLCLNISWISDSQATCNTPPGTGIHIVSIVAGGQNSLHNNFVPIFAYNAPYVTSITPSSGPAAGGNLVTVTGGEFGGSVELFDVMIGGVECANVTVISGQQLSCACPPGVGVYQLVTVTVNFQTSNNIIYYSYYGPIIESIAPNYAPTEGGVIILYGSNFGIYSGVTTVLFNGSLSIGSMEQEQNDSVIFINMQSFIGANYSIEIDVAGQIFSVENAFSYQAPNISSVEYNGTLDSSGGDFLNISGTNFIYGYTDTSIFPSNLRSTVFLSSEELGVRECANISWGNSLEIICITPYGIFQNLTVMIGNQLSNVWPLSYGAPFVDSIQPSNGTTAGRTLVTIFGRNFISKEEIAAYETAVTNEAYNVTIGGVLCSNITWINATMMKITTPAGAGKNLSVVVGVHDKGSNSNVTFSYFPPVIVSMHPAMCNTTGCVIHIEGAEFGTENSNISVAIGPLQCENVTFVSFSEVSCLVPPYAGKNYSVKIDVAGQESNSNLTFSFYGPTIISLVPPTLPTVGGVLTIVGYNFGPGQPELNPSVVFNTSTNLTITLWSDRIVVVAIPPNIGTNKTVSLFIGDQQGSTSAFSYQAPILTATSKTSGSTQGGDVITLTGNNLVPTGIDFGPISYSNISLGASLCSNVQWVNEASLVCTSPAGSGKNKTFTVAVGGQVFTSPGWFSYNAPTITSISPTSGPALGGAILTVIGQDFGTGNPTPNVTVNGIFCTNPTLDTANPPSFMKCTIPSGLGANNPVVVTVDGQSSNQFIGYSYDAPRIDSLSVNHGPTAGGTTITITGANFGNGTIIPKVTLGDSTCQVASGNTDSKLVITTPAGTGENKSLVVEIADQSSAANTEFSYDAPSVSSITPSSGPIQGQTKVVIKGSNFGPGFVVPTVTIGGYDCNVVQWVSDSALSCFTPSGCGIDKAVVVTVDGQSSEEEHLWSYNAPHIESIVPSSGPQTGETLISIEGTDLGTMEDAENGNLEVTVGGEPCTGVSAYITMVTCIVPPSQFTGQVEVVLTLCTQSTTGSYTYNGNENSESENDDGEDPNPDPDIPPVPPVAVVAVLGGVGMSLAGALAAGAALASGSSTASISTGGYITATGGYTTYTTGGSDSTTGSTTGGSHNTTNSTSHIPYLPVLCTFSNAYPPVIQLPSTISPLPLAIPPSNVPPSYLAPTRSLVSVLLTCNNENINNGTSQSTSGCGLNNCVCNTWSWNKANFFCSCAAVNGSSCPVIPPPSNTGFCNVSYESTSVNFTDAAGQSYISPAMADALAFGAYQALVAHVDSSKCGNNAAIKNLVCASAFPRSMLGRALPICKNTALKALHCFTNSFPSTFNGTCFAPGSCNLGDLATSMQVLPDADCSDLSVPVPALVNTTSTPTTGGPSTFTGLNFGNGSIAIRARVQNVLLNATWVSPTSVLAQIAPGAGGWLYASVVVGLQSSSPVPIFFYQAPVVYVLSPTNGTTSNTTGVIITGNNFGSVSDVLRYAWVGGVPVDLYWLSNLYIVIAVPPGIGANLPVTVYVGGLLSNNSTLFSYLPPTISSMTPQYALPAGGVNITITGSNFIPVGYNNTIGYNNFVQINNNPCVQSIWVSASVVVCLVPPGSGTNLPVYVKVGNQMSMAFFGFSYNNTNAIVTSINPSHAPTSGGIAVTLTGTNFNTSQSVFVSIGEVVCMNPTFSSSTNIVCTLQPGINANLTVAVTINGTAANSSAIFSYDAPIITSNTGVGTDGGTLTIYGNNFIPYIPSDGQLCGQGYLSQFNRIWRLSNLPLLSYNTGWLFAISFCPGTPVTGCGSNAATCQSWNPTFNTLGLRSPVVITEISDTVLVVNVTGGTYCPASQANRSTMIVFTCANVPSPTFPSVSEPATCVYQFNINVPYSMCQVNPNVSAVESYVKVNNQSCTPVTWASSTMVSCPAPPGIGANRSVVVGIGNQITSNNSFSYTGPAISKAVNVSVAGGPITITGTNFVPKAFGGNICGAGYRATNNAVWSLSNVGSLSKTVSGATYTVNVCNPLSCAPNATVCQTATGGPFSLGLSNTMTIYENSDGSLTTNFAQGTWCAAGNRFRTSNLVLSCSVSGPLITNIVESPTCVYTIYITLPNSACSSQTPTVLPSYVKVNGLQCYPVSWTNSTSIVCTAPPGSGTNLPLQVTIANQTTIQNVLNYQ